MTAHQEAQERETGRIVQFPTGTSLGNGQARLWEVGSEGRHDVRVADLRNYQESTGPDDYAQRMMVNVIAFAFIVILTLMGIWLAEQLALSRKHQDCALSGRKNCGNIDAQIYDR